MDSACSKRNSASDVMPVTSLKKIKKETDTVCLFCQEGPARGRELRTASEEGRRRVIEVSLERRSLNDISSEFLISRILNTTSENESEVSDTKWHHTCYSNFTHQGMLNRLRKKYKASKIAEPEFQTDDSEVSETFDKKQKTQHPSRRSSNKHAINWEICMFCQKIDGKNMRNVMTMGLSEKIIAMAQQDLVMRVRLANISDLVAAEGKYHVQCWVTFQRKMDSSKFKLAASEQIEQGHFHCLDILCANILTGLNSGHVYDMGNIWVQFTKICANQGLQIPAKYIGRRQSFYDSIREMLGEKAGFIRPIDRKAHLLIYPTNKSDFAIAQHLESAINDDEENLEETDDLRLFPSQSNTVQELVHTALTIRKDLENTPGHSAAWGGIDQDHVAKVIPESLYIFLSVLFGGTDAIEQQSCTLDSNITGVAQDIVYLVSKKKKLTPKHVGLGLTLHQATRSEKLVDLFHAAGHTIGMDTIRRIDTTIASDILARYDKNGNVYIPNELVPYSPNRIVLASCDNIDVLEETIDGKNTFHCTQMMLWQRGPANIRCERDTAQQINRARTITKASLDKFHGLDRASLPVGERPQPVGNFGSDLETDKLFKTKSSDREESKLKNLTWLLARMCNRSEQMIPAWAAFNERISLINSPITTPGMLPILQAPADDNNTITTIINRFMAIAEHLGQPNTVIAADQPLYSKAKEIIWANSEKYQKVVFVMGHLHILFNFLKAIGQHMENSGLADVWVESGVYAQNSTDAMLEGKQYYRAVRGHTLAYEALSRIYWHYFTAWLRDNERELDLQSDIDTIVQEFCHRGADRDGAFEAVNDLAVLLKQKKVLAMMDEFDHTLIHAANFTLWRSYMKMVETLLDFIRANREGNWPLHLDSFSAMLPWMTIYDHTNYARWGVIYLSEMKSLKKTQPLVYEEFMKGNFVVKRSAGKFNQIPIDQATEWQNKICKISNGIIGITRNNTARDKFCMTWAERSYISHCTRVLFGLEDESNDTISTRKDAQPARVKIDESAVKSLEEQFIRFNVFKLDTVDWTDHYIALEELAEDMESEGELINRGNNQLTSLATNDVASDEIQRDILTAEQRGQQKVVENTCKWLVEKSVSFFDPLKKNKSKTFATLYNTTVNNMQNDKKVVKADRKLLQRLLTASLAGRQIDMHSILQHELSNVPLSLAKTNGTLNMATKSDLINILMGRDAILHEVPAPKPEQKTCVFIDGHALIQALGKPPNCGTFNEYARAFFRCVTANIDEHVRRVDVVFDTYILHSIKSATRTKRSSKNRPVRKIIDRGDLPLPQVWANFISLSDNKADLARFLTEYLLCHGKEFSNQYELVTSGGNNDSTKACSTQRGDVINLFCNHEEADTRLILHAQEAVANNYNRLIVLCRDTDVLLLLIHFFGKKQDVETWMVGGSAKQRKCFPVHTITNKLSQDIIQNILGFHAVTGCDTTSSFTGYGKKKCWKVFEEHAHLLSGIGRDDLFDGAEEFVCRIYGAPDPLAGINQCRTDLFEIGSKELEKLPPTKDSLTLHLIRSNYQAKIWLQATIPFQELALPVETGGWKASPDSDLEIVWTTLPSIPNFCVSLIACGCKKKCKSGACKCYKNDQQCTPVCGCSAKDCKNPCGLAEDD